MHTANFLVLLLNGKEFVVARQVSLHEARDAGILLQNFGILHVFQMLRDVGLCFGAEKGRHRHGLGRNFDGTVALHHHFGRPRARS